MAQETPEFASLKAAYAESFAAPQPEAGGTGDTKRKFKTAWPQAKIGLELLRELSATLKGGAVIRSVITVIVTAGDAAFAAIPDQP